MPTKDFYTATEAADYLECSRQWFYDLKEKYSLYPISFGSVKLYPHKELERVRKILKGKK